MAIQAGLGWVHSAISSDVRFVHLLITSPRLICQTVGLEGGGDMSCTVPRLTRRTDSAT